MPTDPDIQQQQTDYWNGPGMARWVREQARLDRVLAPLQRAALRRAAPAPGERVVDIGCGCGASSLALADAVGTTGAVLGVDLSAQMLERAAQRAGARAHLTFCHADAALHHFAGDADLVFSRFGCMFFSDPMAAFTNIRRAVRAGGRACFLCWRGREDNAWMRLPTEVAGRFIELAPPPSNDTPGPLSLARPERVQEVLTHAGFHDIALEPHDEALPVSIEGVDEAVDFALRAGPLARQLQDVGATTLARIAAALREVLTDHCEGQTVTLGAGVWIVTAHR